MAIISRSAGRGSAIAAAVAAAAKPVSSRGSVVVQQPAPVVTRAPVATQSLVQQAVNRAIATSPALRGSAIAAAAQRYPTGSTRGGVVAPPPPRNIIAEILTKNAKYANPVRGSGHLTIGRGYDSIEDQRAAASYTMGPMGAIASIAPRPTADALRYGNQSLVLQQQLADYDMMRMQAGQPPTQMGGYGPEYTVGGGGAAVRPRPRGQTIPTAPPPGTFVPLDIQPSKPDPNPVSSASLDALRPVSNDPHASLRPRGGGLDSVRPRPRGQTLPELEPVPRTENRNSSVLFGQIGDTYLEQVTQEFLQAQQAVDTMEAYLQSPGYYNNPNPMYQSQLVSLRNNRDRLAQEMQAQRDNVNDGPMFQDIAQADDVLDHIDWTINSAVGDFVRESPVGDAFEAATEWAADRVGRAAETTLPLSEVPFSPIGDMSIRDAAKGLGLGAAAVLDWSYQQHTRNVGTGMLILANAALTGVPGAGYIEDVLDKAGLREPIVDAYYNGYTGPGGTHFDAGGNAVFEMLLGRAADDLPWILPAVVKIGAAVFFDPLTGLPIIGRAGRGAAMLGRTMSAIPDASRAVRTAGRVIQGVGRATDVGSTALDSLMLEPIFKKVGSAARRGSLFQDSIATQKTEVGGTLQGTVGEARDAIGRAGSRPAPPPPPDEPFIDPMTGRPPRTPPPSPPGPESTWPTRGPYPYGAEQLRRDQELVASIRPGRAPTPEQAAAAARLQSWQNSTVTPGTAPAPAAAEPVPYPHGEEQLADDLMTERNIAVRTAVGVNMRITPEQGAALDRLAAWREAGGPDFVEPIPGRTVAPSPAAAAPSPRSAAPSPVTVADELTEAAPLTAADVPATFPTLRSVIADAGRIRNEPRLIPNESFTGPRAGGVRAQDIAVSIAETAIRTGDTSTMRRMDNFFRDAEAAARTELGDNQNFRSWKEGSTREVSLKDVPTNASGLGFPISDADRRLLGDGKAGLDRRNGKIKNVYEHASALLHEALVTAPTFTKQFPGSGLATHADPALRVADDMTWQRESIHWLMDEFVRTTDVDRARRIFAVLKSKAPRDSYFSLDANGHLVMNALPPGVKPRHKTDMFIQDEINEMLLAARKEYQTALGRAPQPNTSAQLAGGYGAESQNAAQRITAAEQGVVAARRDGIIRSAQETMRYRSDVMQYAEASGVTRAELQEVADFLGWGSVDQLNYQQLWHLRGVVDDIAPTRSVTTFKTAKGSTYTVHADGTTTRNKAARPEHPGSSGLQPRSSKTIYVHPDDRSAAALYFGQTPEYLARQPELMASIRQSNTPQMGWHPYEVLEDVNGKITFRHWGNPITEIGDATTDTAPTGTVRKAGSKWEAVDADGNVIGTNPTKRDATTRLQNWIAGQQNPGFARLSDAGPRAFSERLQQGRDALTRAADASIVTGIRNEDLRWANEVGELDNASTTYLDQIIHGWKPPGPVLPGMERAQWSVWEAMNWIDGQKIIDPDFDYNKAFDDIAQRAKHYDLDPETGAVRQTAEAFKDRKHTPLARGIDTLSRTRLIKLWDAGMNAILRQHRRYGPLSAVRNMIGDSIGTIWQAVVLGKDEVAWSLRPWNVAQETHVFRAHAKRDPDAFRIADSADDPFLVGTGQLIPKEINPGVSRGEDVLGGLPSANRRAAQYLGPLRHTANLWTVPYGKDFLNGIDLVSRNTNWKQQYRHVMKSEGFPSFWKLVKEVAGDDATFRQWQSAIIREAQSHLNGRPWSGSFSPGDVRNALDGLTNQQHRLARGLQSEIKLAKKRALDDTTKSFFSYKNTNADEIARRIFVFHYWQSRAIPLHVRAAFRNPVLLNLYYKLHQELEERAEANGQPDYLRGMGNTAFQFWQTPTGIASYVSPWGSILPTTMADLYTEDGERLGVVTQQMAPDIIAGLGILGADVRTPDVFGTNQDEMFIKRILNAFRGQGADLTKIPVIGEHIGNDLATNTFTEPMIRGFMEWMNGALSDAGLPVGELEMFDRGASELDQMRSWVQYHAEEQFGPRFDDTFAPLWTPEQMELYREALVGIVSGVPGNPLSDAARESISNEELITAGLGLVVPAGAPVVSQSRTDRMAADRAGDRSAGVFRDEATASDPTWAIASRAYHDIGTPLQQDIWDTYYDILFNPEELRHQQLLVWDEEAGIYRRIPGSALAGMTEEELQEAADWWLSMYPGGQEAIDHIKTERDAFKAANPEFADYTTYQAGVYKYEGGPSQFITDMGSNPNFQRALDDQEEWLKQQGYKGATLQAELEQWAASEAAFHAAIGEQYNIYGSDPISVYDGSNDPYANNPFRTVMGQGTPVSEDDEEEEAEDEVDPKSPAGQAAKWEAAEIEEDKRRGWSNYAAEQLYGDAWDQEAAATDPKKGFPYKTNDPLTGEYYYTNYYPDDAPPKPGESSNENRFIEWQRVMRAQGVPENQLTVEAWAAWETDTYEEYLESIGQSVQQETAVPDLWTYWLDDKRAA